LAILDRGSTAGAVSPEAVRGGMQVNIRAHKRPHINAGRHHACTPLAGSASWTRDTVVGGASIGVGVVRTYIASASLVSTTKARGANCTWQQQQQQLQ
jgi:hypothetical protein